MDIRWSDGKRVSGIGTKQMAIIALLASSPKMVRTRAWLIDKLWARVDQKHGRSSLRQALTNLRQTFGARFDSLFIIEPDRIGLNPEIVLIEGDASHGELMEGLDIAEEGFEEWLRDSRLHGLQLTSTAQPCTAPATPPVEIRPVVSVLPFAFHGQSNQMDGIGDYFAREITRTLSQSNLMNLTSHLSSRQIDFKTIDLGQIRARLNTDFLITGAVRENGGRIILHVDCIDCVTGEQIWTERFDTLEEAFFDPGSALFTEIAAEIVGALMTDASAFVSSRALPDLPAHRLLMSSISLMFRINGKHFNTAHDRLGELIARAPGHSIPYAWSAQWHLLRIYQGWSNDPELDHSKASELVERGLDNNPFCSISHAIEGNIKTVLASDFDGATVSFAEALSVNRSSALTHSLKCVLHTFKNDGEQAIAAAERSMLLSPLDPRKHFFENLYAGAYLVGEQFDKAVACAEASIAQSPQHISAHRAKVIGLSLAQRLPEARAAAATLLKLAPELTTETYVKNHPAKDTGVAARWADALAQAGVPQT